MALIKLNGREFEVEPGTTVLEVARQNGIEIPHYCYHPRLEIVGSCRMCMVEVEGMPKLTTSCSLRINEMPEERKVDGKYDMVVSSESDKVKQTQKSTLEFLLINHPLDCPVCDQAGECYLQDYSFKYGKAHSRFKEEKRVRPAEQLGPKVRINHNRCIMCTRCVRFAKEIAGTAELGVVNRGYYSKIGIVEGKELDNKMAGNVVDICPVGALLSNDFLYKTRVWNLEETSSICPECSVGCNIEVHVKDNKVQRLIPRINEEVNDHWMCDDGRFEYHKYEDADRIENPLVKKDSGFERISWTGAIKLLLEKFSSISREKGKEAIGGFGSAYMTNEENYLFEKMMRKGLGVTENLGLYPGDFEGEPEVFKSGFQINPDKTPNRLGASDMLNLDKNADLFQLMRNNTIKALFFLHGGYGDNLSNDEKLALRKLDFLVVQDFYMSDIAKEADLILPGGSVYERTGTMTNYQGRVQKIQQGLYPEGDERADYQIIMDIANAMRKNMMDYRSVWEVTSEISDSVEGYTGLTRFEVNDSGKLKTNAALRQTKSKTSGEKVA